MIHPLLAPSLGPPLPQQQLPLENLESRFLKLDKPTLGTLFHPHISSVGTTPLVALKETSATGTEFAADSPFFTHGAPTSRAVAPSGSAAVSAPAPSAASSSDREIETVEADPLASGRTCASRYGALVLVKGVQSHVVTPDGAAWKYDGGGPGLGVSGSGDTLAGITGGLLARGADPLTALLWAVWLHGEAGKALAQKVGALGFLAREIPGEVPASLPIR